MKKIIILCTILLIVIITLAGRYFSDLAGKTNTDEKVLDFIPADAALILHFKNNPSFFEIFKDYELFEVIIGKDKASELNLLKDLLDQSPFSELSIDKNIFLSLHHTTDSTEFLFNINLDKSPDLYGLISENKSYSVIRVGENIYQLSTSKFKKPLFLFLREGAAIASFSETLLKRSIDTKRRRLSPYFVNEIVRESKKNLNSPIHLFVNHETIAPFIQNFLVSQSGDDISLLKNTQGVSSLSMNFKSDALMFNGLSKTDALTPHYLNLFLHQSAVPNRLKKIVPRNTAKYLEFGISNRLKFQRELVGYFSKRKELKALERNLNEIHINTGVNPNRDIAAMFDDEFITIENSYKDKFAIIKVLNGRRLNFKLQLISTPLNNLISKLNYKNVFYYYFGEPLKPFYRPYFTIIDNYLIVSNNPNIITNYLTAYESEYFLSNTEAFKQYDQLVATQSNISFFVNLKNSERQIRSALKPTYSRLTDDLKKFYGISFQWTGDEDHFFTNLYLNYNSSDSLTLMTRNPN